MNTASRIFGPLLLAALVGTTGTAASAAILRSRVALHSANVRLSDLFSGLQAGQDCDIGPAPAPGQHIVIPSSQLSAIASQFGVDWQPGSSYASTTLERSARVIRAQEIIAVLKPALVSSGASPDADIALGAFATRLLPAETTAAAEIQSLDYDAQSGRFAAMLIFPVSDGDPMTLRVTGRAERQINVLALIHALPAGATPSVADIQSVRVRADALRGTPVTNLADIAGLAFRQNASAGPLTREMLVRPMLVNRGRPVVLRLESFGLALTAAGTALEAGAAGDRIHVLNSPSHAILVGQITGAAEVQIDPGTAPMIMQQGSLQGGLPQLASGSPSAGPSWNNSAQAAQYR